MQQPRAIRRKKHQRARVGRAREGGLHGKQQGGVAVVVEEQVCEDECVEPRWRGRAGVGEEVGGRRPEGVPRDGDAILLRGGEPAVTDVVGQVLEQLGVGVVGYDDAAGAEEGGGEGGEAGAGAELEDGFGSEEAGGVGGVLEVGRYGGGGVPEVVALGGGALVGRDEGGWGNGRVRMGRVITHRGLWPTSRRLRVWPEARV